MTTGFGLAHLKKEGAPAHPEDIYTHCGCEKCELRWQQQLKAYNDYWKNTEQQNAPGAER